MKNVLAYLVQQVREDIDRTIALQHEYIDAKRNDSFVNGKVHGLVSAYNRLSLPNLLVDLHENGKIFVVEASNV